MIAVKVGDRVELKDPFDRISYAGVSGGKVVSIGRVNVKVRCCVRCSPTGPWFVQVHKVSRAHITHVFLAETLPSEADDPESYIDDEPSGGPP